MTICAIVLKKTPADDNKLREILCPYPISFLPRKQLFCELKKSDLRLYEDVLLPLNKHV